MADSLLTMTLGVGASLVKVLLQANGCVTEANFAEVAKEGLGILSWWMNRGGDADGQLAKQIAEILAKKTRDMYEVYRAQGIDEEQLGGVVTEVEILFNKVVENDELLLLAVNDPDSFSEVLQDDIRQRRKNIESRLEPYFDKLVKAAVDEYVKLAPWSPKFQIEALKDLINKADEILKNTAKGLENDEIIIAGIGHVTKGIDVLLERGDAEVASKVSVQKPLIFGRRPYVVESYYIEREEQVRLRNLINEDPRLRVVLVGMRGCGKSQLASELAWSCEEKKWHLVAWINATSKEQVRSGLIELANRLGIETQGRNEESIIEQCFSYLESGEPSDRLIVFDNVEDINHLTKLVPRGDGLRVVVTTTNDCGWKNQSWESIKVGVFSREDSIKCLLRITDSKDREAADAVAQKLGDLPLAIAQAGATACAEDWTLKKYLVRLKRYSISRVIKPVRGDSYTEEVYKALLMAVDAALDKLGGDEREVARRQLDGLVVLAQSGVPTRWIDPLSTDVYSSDLEENVPDSADENAHSALTMLVSMSVVQQSADKTITLLHRLQAQVLRENWGKEKTATCEEAFDAAVEILGRTKYEQLPSNATDARRREVRDLIAQLSAIAVQDYSRSLFEREQVRGYLYSAFKYAYNLGSVYEAVELSAAVGVIEDILGADHPDTLTVRNNLALAYESVGRLAEAIDAWEELLPDCQRVLGADHPDTLTVRNNLAIAYKSVGRFGEAIELFEQVLGEREGLLGPDHPDTLAVRNNLASAYKSVGRFGEAIDAWEELLPDCQRVLGADHPYTLTVRNNLAGAYRSVRRFGEAIDVWEELLPDCQRVLGADHPYTLTVRNNLAGAYRSVRRFGEAIDA
ncbi:MAG: tetratricopeptide repeat protein, partial [Actinomyces graevenitzii]|nr:tetratricopeptide repeat protein [Actinomyces graevenitzii]